MSLVSPVIHQRRILGAIRFRDGPTGETVRLPLKVTHPRLAFTRNLSGLYAITGLRPDGTDEEALAAHLSAFSEAPASPAAGAVPFTLDVTDPTGVYLARRLTVRLPRGEDWDTAIDADLYPGAAAPVAPNWSGVRATLERTEGGARVPLAGARLRLLRDSDSVVLGTGYADQRGEVLAVAVGIPVVDFTATPATGTAPAASVGAKTVAARIEIHTAPGTAWPPDPQAIETSGQSWVPVAGGLPTPELRTGRLETADLALHLQPQP